MKCIASKCIASKLLCFTLSESQIRWAQCVLVATVVITYYVIVTLFFVLEKYSHITKTNEEPDFI